MAMDELKEFQDLGLYKTFLAVELKKFVPGEPQECFLSKEEITYEKDFEGYLFLVGPKGAMAMKRLKSKNDIKFFEGVCTLTEENLYLVSEITCPVDKRVKPLLRQLSLNKYTVRKEDEGEDPVQDAATGVEPEVLAAAGAVAAAPEIEAATEAEPVETWQSARDAYIKAAEKVEAQLRQLSAALTKREDEDLRQIASRDLRTVLGSYKTPLLAALRELDGDATRGNAAKRARPYLQRYAAHLAADPRVAACDNNPFRVGVTLRKTLTPVLGRLEKALAALA